MMPALPASLAPTAPFPLVVSQSSEIEFVAPGVRRAVYRLTTTDGPLVVTVVAVDPREPTVRFASVVAHDALISAGETVSSMARRTGAVAGVNADYFDIGQTNQPLNLVVRDGTLVRTPSKRVVLDVRTDRSVHFENATFAGSLRYGTTTLPVTAVNEWPPQGGVSVLTAAFGPLQNDAGLTLARIVPVAAATPGASLSGSYLVSSLDASTRPTVNGTLLGFGPAARALGPLPNVGDTLELSAETTPPLATIANAVGGGPLLIANGAVADDPNAPAPEERDRRFPVSGAATRPDGEVVLVAVDGRRQALSIGVTRPQFAALMLAFGATDAMAFDSGGSATLVARVLGETDPRALNSPSDGAERVVADGLFVYSDAATGPPAILVVRPARIVALPDVTVPVTLALADEAGHPVPADAEPRPRTIASTTASHVATLRANGLTTRVPVDVVARLARLDVVPAERDPDPGALVDFVASGSDELGRIVALGDRVRWSSDRGEFVRPGIFRAPDRDARVEAATPGARAAWTLRVGHHRESFALRNDGADLPLAYDFKTGERAVYADSDIALPGEPRSFSVEINGDRSGVAIGAAFRNALGERRALTLVRVVDWQGWRSETIALPDDLNPPVRLISLSVLPPRGGGTGEAEAGTIAFRNASVVVAGTP